MPDWQTTFEQELKRASEMRVKGNEGQARVCARRAAGIVIREYLKRNGRPIPSSSAYDLLSLIAGDETLDPTLRQSAFYLTLRVTEEFKLPVEVDLLEQASILQKMLITDY